MTIIPLRDVRGLLFLTTGALLPRKREVFRIQIAG